MSNIVKEYESRIMLTESEYFEIVSHFMRLYPNKHFLKNVNVYFDTDDLYLRKNHITLRVRIVNDVMCELTLKKSGNNGDDEINDTINLSQTDAILKGGYFPEGNVKNYLLSLSYPLSEYHQIVTLYNRRLEIKYDDHLLVIDKNTYSDIVDYNLEIETEKDIALSKEILEKYIKKFNLSLQMQKYQGKATRAIRSVKSLD